LYRVSQEPQAHAVPVDLKAKGENQACRAQQDHRATRCSLTHPTFYFLIICVFNYFHNVDVISRDHQEQMVLLELEDKQ